MRVGIGRKKNENSWVKDRVKLGFECSLEEREGNESQQRIWTKAMEG